MSTDRGESHLCQKMLRKTPNGTEISTEKEGIDFKRLNLLLVDQK
jgi:hypothetical protein